jgi:hypothetical protein
VVAERRGEVVEGSWEEIDEQAVGALSHGVGRAGEVADVRDRDAHAAQPGEELIELVVCTPRWWTVPRTVLRGGWSTTATDASAEAPRNDETPADAGASEGGRGGFRTCDLSRLKRDEAVGDPDRPRSREALLSSMRAIHGGSGCAALPVASEAQMRGVLRGRSR